MTWLVQPTIAELRAAIRAQALQHLATASRAPKKRRRAARHRRHFERAPTRGYWSGCRCRGCIVRRTFEMQTERFATHLREQYERVAKIASDASLITATGDDLRCLARVFDL